MSLFRQGGFKFRSYLILVPYASWPGCFQAVNINRIMSRALLVANIAILLFSYDFCRILLGGYFYFIWWYEQWPLPIQNLFNTLGKRPPVLFWKRKINPQVENNALARTISCTYIFHKPVGEILFDTIFAACRFSNKHDISIHENSVISSQLVHFLAPQKDQKI